MEISEVIKNIRSQLGLFQEGLAREKPKPNHIARHASAEHCRKNNLDQNLTDSLEVNNQVKVLQYEEREAN